MKKLSKKIFAYPILFSIVIVLGSIILLAAGGGINRTFPTRSGDPVTVVATTTYDTATVDTLLYNREAGVTALAFGIETLDSVEFINVIVRRVVDGTLSPLVAGDTILGATQGTTNAGNAYVKAVTLAPLCDQYRFIVTYDTLQGLTSPTVKYLLYRQYK